MALCLCLYIAVSVSDGNVCHAQEICTDLNPRPIPSLFREDTLTISFMGDMMIHSKQIETADKGNGIYDFSSYFHLIEDRIRRADIAVANMEFTLAGEPYTGYPCFSAPDGFARYLAECGFDIFLTANNHIFDRSATGAARTLEVYRRLEESHGIRTTGLAENEHKRQEETPLIIRAKGIKAAFINFTYGTNLGCGASWPKTNYQSEIKFLENALDIASDNADVTIVLPHWGEEYILSHSKTQENTARWLSEHGSDIIIGTHPHVVQDTAVINRTQVAYSLGNAVSNMSAQNTQLELMATLRIVKKGNMSIHILPLEFTWLWCSRPGGFDTNYTVIPIEDYIGRREEWHGAWDYDKMMTTYTSVRKTNNITE